MGVKYTHKELEDIYHGRVAAPTKYAKRIANKIVGAGVTDRAIAGGKKSKAGKVTPVYKQKYDDVVKAVKNGMSLSKAAKENNITSAKVKALNEQYKALAKIEGKYIATYLADIRTPNKLYRSVRVDYENMQILLSYWKTVVSFEAGKIRDVNILDTFKDVKVYDIFSQEYQLSTDLRTSVKDLQTRKAGKSFPVVSP